MEKKIVGGGAAKAESGAAGGALKAEGENGVPSGGAAGEEAQQHNLTFKAKREAHKQLKNKKMLKQVENEQRQQMEE